MDSLLYEFKNAWNRPNNALPQIIIINVVVFVILGVLHVFGNLFGVSFISDFIYSQFSIPPLFGDFIQKPWTLLTYSFAHSLDGLRHILFNMLMLYWFGRLIVEYLGSQKLINLYVLGAIFGAVTYLLAYNFIPFYIEKSHIPGMVGASAAALAITTAAATLLPEYSLSLVFIGPVKLKYIAAVTIFISFLGTVGGNAGGELAHLGGALIGYVYIKQLKAGTDWGIWIMNTMTFFKSFFTKQAPMKVTNKKKKTTKTSAKGGSMSTNMANQADIDRILDKISQSGYESLSKEEKQQLFNASKN